MSKQSLSEWLCSTEKLLQNAHIETARLDALVLVCDELRKDKAWVLAHPEYVLQGSILKKLNTKITQRTQHIPLAYIRGESEFFGRQFMVNEHVLVPRPESEAIITLLISFYSHFSTDRTKNGTGDGTLLVIDVGTGSGALGITAKLELSACEVFATDIDRRCLAVAKQNARDHSADITFMQGDLLAPFQGSRFKIQDSILLANLPYVPEDYRINKAAGYEPKRALYGGVDGLDYYRRLFRQARAIHIQAIITESLREQHDLLSAIAQSEGYKLCSTDGLAQLYQASVLPHPALR